MHYVSKVEVVSIEHAALSHFKIAWRPPLLDESTSFGQGCGFRAS